VGGVVGQHWFETALNLAERELSRDPALAQEIRRLLAKRFRRIWATAGTHGALEKRGLESGISYGGLTRIFLFDDHADDP